ncbi:hypothetical protein [Gordonia neofelifaecis]|uniref:Uncharacterized protein n=1 Tax=Gordonia neofelifaecis NRRL B-59395 TaxID=644548 RepID=F1YPU9_9ACTN|nr:hypothetical protein [Gordonia neofelifaecis]EGD53279.1 hypothetical protein SCNU_19817 [Gordonia neofelifaecis NRRL B-59395]
MTNTDAASKVTKAIDDSTKQIQDVQTALLDATKQTALASLDVYEKSISTVLDFQQKVIGSTGLAAADGVVAAQVKLFSDLNAAGVSAARSVLA